MTRIDSAQRSSSSTQCETLRQSQHLSRDGVPSAPGKRAPSGFARGCRRMLPSRDALVDTLGCSLAMLWVLGPSTDDLSLVRQGLPPLVAGSIALLRTATTASLTKRLFAASRATGVDCTAAVRYTGVLRATSWAILAGTAGAFHICVYCLHHIGYVRATREEMEGICPPAYACYPGYNPTAEAHPLAPHVFNGLRLAHTLCDATALLVLPLELAQITRLLGAPFLGVSRGLRRAGHSAGALLSRLVATQEKTSVVRRAVKRKGAATPPPQNETHHVGSAAARPQAVESRGGDAMALDASDAILPAVLAILMSLPRDYPDLVNEAKALPVTEFCRLVRHGEPQVACIDAAMRQSGLSRPKMTAGLKLLKLRAAKSKGLQAALRMPLGAALQEILLPDEPMV